MALDVESPVPLYHQLKEILMAKIASGEWRPDARIPTEAELCREFKVSRGTVRQALSSLVAERLILRRPGRGSFVSPPKLEQSLNRFYSFAVVDMKSKGLEPVSKVLQARLIHPPAQIKKALKLEEGQAVVKVVRLRSAGHEPIALEKSYLTAELFPHLLKEDLSCIPLYDLLSQRYGLKISRAKETLEITLLDRFESEALGSPQGTPALLVERITYSNDEPFEYRRSVIRADRSRYVVEIYPE